MKKSLIVLGLAMCATVAMGQTKKPANLPLSNSERFVQKIKAEASAKPVDYKSSIFVKDDEDIVTTFDFASSNMQGIVYGSNAVMQTGDVVDGEAINNTNRHSFSASDTYWQRFTYADIPDSANGTLGEIYGGSATFNNLYPEAPYYGATKLRLGTYLDDSVASSGNGFMFISLIDHHGQAGNFHAYFQLPAVTMPANRPVIDVDFYQYHRKFYDNTYIDYKDATGAWHSVEVNVNGVDVDVNGTSPRRVVATLPVASTVPSTLELRFRIFGPEGYAAHGYMWGIDDVKIVVSNVPARWRFHTEGFIDGFYGTLPQQFNIPLSYTVYVRNNGIENLTGNHMMLNHIAPSGTTTQVMDRAQADAPTGDVLHNYVFRFNERGFMDPEAGFDSDGGYDHAMIQNYNLYSEELTTAAWRASSNQMGTTAQAMAAGYGMQGLPTDNAGKNQFYISLGNNQGLSRVFDTITYTVSSYKQAEPEYGIMGGYRWAHDNGVIPGGSEYAWQFDSPYVTNDPEVGHQYAQSFQLYTRYNSPSVIPTDADGQPWVIRGIEYVTASTLTANDVENREIAPMLMVQALNDTGGLEFLDVVTGLSSNVLEVVPATAAQESRYGYILPGEPYNAFDLKLPAQPELIPNATYLVGYINGGGTFAVAQTQYSWAQDASTNVSYYRTPDLQDYYLQFGPLNKPYDVWTYDPEGSSNSGNHSIFGFNIDCYPMVRLIVGPREDVRKVSILSECAEEEDNEYWIYRADLGSNVCGYLDTNLYAGGSVTYYVLPGNPDEDGGEVIGNMVIDNIYIDNEPINLEDSTVCTAIEYNVYAPGHGPDADEEWPPLLERVYYRVSLRNLQDDHVISAAASPRELRVLEAEDKVNLTLAPNPATSQVKLSLEGVNGMVQCSIIDMSGRVVYSSEINGNNETTISLNGIAAGAYFVRVTGNDFSKVEKLIVR